MRIRNPERLTSHGNREGRRHAVEILEAGLSAADPYHNARRLLKLENGRLHVGFDDFVPFGSPRTGTDIYDLSSDIDRIFVFGAGKGIQRVAKAFEDVLGDYLTGGFVLLKHCDEHELKRIEVAFGGHPIPDEDCLSGCRRLVGYIDDCRLTERDLVFTIIGNGASSLLTMPWDDISFEDVKTVTQILQIEKGLPTPQVNIVRNQLDKLKGGRITRLFAPARMVHIFPIDLDEPNAYGDSGYEALMKSNFWLHTLPDMSSPEMAVRILRESGAWELMPESILRHLQNPKPGRQVLGAREFEQMDCRVFGIMPTKYNFIPAAMKAAENLGYRPHFLMRRTFVEAATAGALISRIALNVAAEDAPFQAPCALLLTGELVVTVDKENGVGGRNQEFALSAATVIKGQKRIVVAAADTDGTDGPGGHINDEAAKAGCSNLAGGIVDGYTVSESERLGVGVDAALRTHGTSDALWKLDSGVWCTPNISVQDLILVLIMDHDG